MTANLQITNTNQRIDILDILRGFALFGMIIAHLAGDSVTTKADIVTDKIITLFVYERFHTIFAILFGAGFAIQFARANANDERFVPRYLRRLLALFCFGLIAEIGLGNPILVDYSLCGLLLLVVRKWSTKALIIIMLISIFSSQLGNVASNVIYVAQHGVEKLKEQYKKRIKLSNQRMEQQKIAATTTDYLTAASIRLKNHLDKYTRPLALLTNIMWNDFVFFLIGFLAMRLKIFEYPLKNLRLILYLMGFGIICWAIHNWILPSLIPIGHQYIYPNISLVKYTFNNIMRWAIFRDTWLSFTYIGAILLLTAYNPTWIKRLKFFGVAGRMALTNFMLQLTIASLLTYNYAFAVLPFPQRYVPLLSLLLFVILVLFSRWWLTRFQFGPFEWIWRSFTYWKWQPMKKKETIQTTEAIA